MKAQPPAQGILAIADYGDSKSYRIACECGTDEHSHDVFVEADDCGVSVIIYTQTHTKYWEDSIPLRYDIENNWLTAVDWAWKSFWNSLARRLKLTKEIWVNGYCKYEACVVLKDQAAINYADAIKTAVEDVKKFRGNK